MGRREGSMNGRKGGRKGERQCCPKGKSSEHSGHLGRRNNFSCSQRTISEPHLKNKSPFLPCRSENPDPGMHSPPFPRLTFTVLGCRSHWKQQQHQESWGRKTEMTKIGKWSFSFNAFLWPLPPGGDGGVSAAHHFPAASPRFLCFAQN